MSLIDQYPLIIGFDTEYVFGPRVPDAPLSVKGRQCRKCSDKGSGKHCPPKLRSRRKCNPPGNGILSYQLAMKGTSTGRTWEHIFYTGGLSPKNRLNLGPLLIGAVSAAWDRGLIDDDDLIIKKRRGAAPVISLNVLMAAHFSRAEVSSFAGFGRLKSRFDAVRGAFVTLQHRNGFKATTRLALHLEGDARPRLYKVTLRLRLLDSFLLAPAGFASLGKIGDKLGLEKLSLPAVRTEDDSNAPGIKRMDLSMDQHLEAFEAYAIRDAIISRLWIETIAAQADEWQLDQIPPTIGSMGVAKMLKVMDAAGVDARHFFGWHKPKGEDPRLLPSVADVRHLAADCFHGGLNTAFVHGIFEGRPIIDWDLAGAYSTAMAALRVPDWDNRELTTDADRLAVLDHLTLARARFRFSGGTHFPCLPVDTGDYGLIYPLEGLTCCAGPELFLADRMGAEIAVEHGCRVPWENDLGIRPLVEFTKFINAERVRQKVGGNEILEQVAKTCGNGSYGKIAQAVSQWKTNPRVRKLLDARTGANVELPPSRISNPVLAAFITSLVRATLAEAVAMLPPSVTVLTATTDGWLSDATEAQAHAAMQGPVGRYFAELRGMVDPTGDPTPIEPKHYARKVLVTKTRGTVSIELDPDAPEKFRNKPILARAGHKLEEKPEEELIEVSEWEAIIRNRAYGDTMLRKNLIPLRDQYFSEADLIDQSREVKMNLDYDFKRRPLNVHDYDGLIRFETEPWQTVDEFLDWRRSWDSYRKQTRSVLRVADDWWAFVGWRGAGQPKGVTANWTPFQRAIVAAYGHRLPGFERREDGVRGWETGSDDADSIAAMLAEVGIEGVTGRTIRNALSDYPDPTGTIDRLIRDDGKLFDQLAEVIGTDALESLCCNAARPKAEITVSRSGDLQGGVK